MRKEEQRPLSQAEVNAIIADWNSPVDFSNRLLVGIYLHHNRSLECSDFRGATLRGCTFAHCKFDNSHFEGADLGDTAFVRCKMEYCFFDGAQMEHAEFDRCARFGSTGIDGDTRRHSEVIFDDNIGIMRGVDIGLAPGWRQFAWEQAGPDMDAYDRMLFELYEKFFEIDDAYPGMGTEIFNSRLFFLPDSLRGAANFIAQGGTVGMACQLAAQGAFTGAEPLPECEMFVLPHSDVQNNILAERAFFAQIRNIRGADFGKLHDWTSLARDLSETDNGAYDHAEYRRLLQEFGDTFEQIQQRYGGIAAGIFNHEAGYLPGELLPAAEWISSDGGSAEEAVEMARGGMFLASGPEEFGGPAMKMQ